MPDARGDDGIDLDGYCRAIESHLCRKNDGHLIRDRGPDLRSRAGLGRAGSAAQGGAGGHRSHVRALLPQGGASPAFAGQLLRGGRARRLRRLADVRSACRARPWPTAAGPSAHVALPDLAGSDEPDHAPRGASLPAHLERVANRLTLLRGDPRHDAAMDAALAGAALRDGRGPRQARARRVGRRASRSSPGSRPSMTNCWRSLVPAWRPERLQALLREAVDALAPFRQRMPPERIRGRTPGGGDASACVSRPGCP